MDNIILTEKLNKVLEIISRNLTQNKIPFAVIGAIALGLYGLPRFTSDIDLIVEGRLWPPLDSIMERLGYSCYQKTDAFAQFESELGAMGYIDFMFVNTPDGVAILNRSIVVEDELLGKLPVVQPADYIILKMMAIANNPDRSIKDEADLSAFMQIYRNRLLPDYFEPLDRARIYLFADRFGQRKLIEKYLDRVSNDENEEGPFKL
ncbi:MAG: hypothetical protein ISS65_09050 [Desulfobacterales bacterium]|uniref:Nucleotidyltransferase family protein n=1 Tax=Candidatus Desulfatibia profunda TaxID=2841695 RepID=A0A8J6NL66_9BACT|nr:hypothetical protein [Candidatus Desulfatibia profunda]MBL7180339.1 hypothetical protein [Desulfobacterales bacterium]